MTDKGADEVRKNLELAVLTSMGYFKFKKADTIANGADGDERIKKVCEMVGPNPLVQVTPIKKERNHDLKKKFFKEKSSVCFQTKECLWGKVPDGDINQYRIDVDIFRFKKKIKNENTEKYQYVIYDKGKFKTEFTLEKNSYGWLPFPETGNNWGRFGMRDNGGDNWIDEEVCAALFGYFYSLPLNDFSESLYYNDINAHDGRDIGHKGHTKGNDIDLRYPGSCNGVDEVLWTKAMKSSKYGNDETKFKKDVELVLEIATKWGFKKNYAYKSNIKHTEGKSTRTHQNHYHLGYK